MAQKNVDLVITAKDQAAKVVDQITDSIKGFTDAQAGMGAAANKTSSVLGSLGTALNTLAKTFASGTSGPARIAAEMDRASAATAKMGTALASSKSEADRLAEATATTAANTAKLSAELAKANEELEREQKGQSQAAASARLAAVAAREATTEVTKQGNASARLTQQLADQQTRLDAATATFRKLTESMAGTEKPSAALVSSFLSASNAVEQQQAKFDKLTGRIAANNAAIEQAKATQTSLSAASNSANGALAAQQEKADAAAASVQHFAVALNESSKAEGALAQAADKNNASIASQAASLAKAEEAFLELKAAATQADVALKVLADETSKGLNAALDAQDQKVRDATASLLKLEDQQARAAASLSSAKFDRSTGLSSAPVAPAQTDYNAAKAAAQAQSQALAIQVDAYNRLQAIVRETGTTVEQLASKEQRATQVITDTNAALAATQATGEEAQKGLQAAGAAALALEEKLAAGSAQFRSAIAAQAGVVAGTRAALDAAIAEQDKYTAALAATRAPSDELKAAVLQLDEAVGSLHGVFDDQSASLEKMQSAARVTATSLSQLAVQQRAFSEASSGSSQAARGSETAQRAVATATHEAAEAFSEAAPKAFSFSDAFTKIYGEGRQSLSFFQRLRGEVLSTAASFGGLYAAFEGVEKVIDSYKVLEQSKNRLTVVFGADDTKSQAEELDFLRREADRLGISFGTLAEEYTKFAVSTKNTNLEGERTRDIFLSVAEAARVNHLSVADTEGVFLALSQIVSKGNVQMEELRGQLGDRLPGALKIMADGLGITTADLDKLVQQGGITSAALIPFAAQLRATFAPALADSLISTTAAFGRLGNAMYEAFLHVAQGGFIEHLTALISALAEKLKSPEFETGLNRISALLGFLSDALLVVVNNLGIVGAALGAFTGIKVAVPLVQAFIGTITQMYTQLTLVPTAVGVASVALTEMATVSGVAATGIELLGTAFRFFTSSTGVGLIVTAIAAGIGLWATQADSATTSINQHRVAVDAARNAYDAVGGSVDKWADSLKKVSTLSEGQLLVQQKQNVDAYTDSIAKLSKAAGTIGKTSLFSSQSGTQKFYSHELQDEIKGLQDGSVTVKEFNEKITELYKSKIINDSELTNLTALTEGMSEAGQRVKEGAATLDIYQGKATSATAATLNLGNAGSKAGASLTDIGATVEKFGKALDDVKSNIPELADSMERLSKIDALEKSYATAVKLVQSMSELNELNRRYAEAKDGINNKYGDGSNLPQNGTALQQSFSLIAQREQFRSKSYLDSDGRYRVGYGSDTVTHDDGTIGKVDSTTTTDLSNATKDLTRRIVEFQDTIKGQIGAGKFDEFNERQQAALTDVAYNYGSLPKSLVATIKSTTDSKAVADAVRQLAGDNNGANADRRNQEADIIQAGTLDPRAAADAYAKANDEAKKLADKQTQFHTELKGSITDTQFEAQQIALENQKLGEQAAVNRAIHAAEENAVKNNTSLTAEERTQIEAATKAQYEQQHATDATTDALKAAKDQTKLAVDLQKAQKGLQDQMTIAQKSGDGTAYGDAKDKLVGVNEELQKAADKAIEMWKAIGGPESVAAIAKLETLKAKGDAASTTLLIDFKKVEDLFANDLTDAIVNFGEAVGKGEGIGASAAAAFRSFAASFLEEIAKMILKQLVLNALKSAFAGSSFFGTIGTAATAAAVVHSGGVVNGSLSRTRSIDPAVFAAAPRMHTGGIPGLAPDEYATILQKNEEVLPANDPRNVLNGGASPVPAAGGAGGVNLKIVNTIDPADVVSQGLGTEPGQQAIMNVFRSNKSTIKALLG